MTVSKVSTFVVSCALAVASFACGDPSLVRSSTETTAGGSSLTVSRDELGLEATLITAEGQRIDVVSGRDSDGRRYASAIDRTDHDTLGCLRDGEHGAGMIHVAGIELGRPLSSEESERVFRLTSRRSWRAFVELVYALPRAGVDDEHAASLRAIVEATSRHTSRTE